MVYTLPCFPFCPRTPDAGPAEIEAQPPPDDYIEFALAIGPDYASGGETRSVFEDRTVYHPDASTDVPFFHSDGTVLSTAAHIFGTDYDFNGHRIMMNFDLTEYALTFELDM